MYMCVMRNCVLPLAKSCKSFVSFENVFNFGLSLCWTKGWVFNYHNYHSLVGCP